MSCSVEDRIAWYVVRDMFNGANSVKRNIPEALKLATTCKHPEAVWLTSIFAMHDNIHTQKDARQVFLSHKNDDKAAYFACLFDVNTPINQPLLKRLVNGYQYYSASLPFVTDIHWAENAASQGERDGFYWLGYCYDQGYGCEKSKTLAMINYLNAAFLGHRRAMAYYATHLAFDDPQRIVWLVKAGNVFGRDLVTEMDQQMENFNAYWHLRRIKVVFALGRGLKGRIEESFIIGVFCSPKTIKNATQAIRFFEFQLQEYRKAVDTWTIIGLRYNVVKDIRKMIGEMIWKARDDATFVFE